MSQPIYDEAAVKRSVSVTLNSDLHAKARALGLNVSAIAEEALATAVRAAIADRIRTEIREELRWLDAFTDRHGSFAEMVREHYAAEDDAASV